MILHFSNHHYTWTERSHLLLQQHDQFWNSHCHRYCCKFFWINWQEAEWYEQHFTHNLEVSASSQYIRFPGETRLQQVCQGDEVSLPYNLLKDMFWWPGKKCCDYQKKKKKMGTGYQVKKWKTSGSIFSLRYFKTLHVDFNYV